MNINKNNYEAFFLDYHEGNLSPHQVADLLLFVEQHPELKEEFESFENIVLEEFSEIKFENKNNLKRNVSDNILISSMEGLLSKEENVLLNQQLSADAKLQHEFLLYQKTKLTADNTIVFENKNELKRREKKVIPIYYYVAAAASLLLLAGLFFMFNNSVNENKLANQEVKSQIPIVIGTKVKSLVKEQPLIGENHKEEKISTSPNIYSAIAVNEKVKNSINEHSSLKEEKDLVKLSEPSDLVVKKETPVILNNDNQQLADTKQPTIAQLENKTEIAKPAEYLSLRELATAKIKEKTLAETTLKAEKKTGRLKKLSGWDLAQIAAKGVNKLTGRKVEVKPTYNEQGDVTAYSLAAGDFQITRGR